MSLGMKLANRRRYLHLKSQHRCINCCAKLSVMETRVRCVDCNTAQNVRIERKRAAIAAEAVPEPKRHFVRCARCHLVLPHHGCLPGIDAYASRRAGVDVL